VIALAESFWFGSPRDDALAIELIGLSRHEIPHLPWSFFERWRKPLRTWHDTDGLGICVFGPWLAADLSRVGKLEELITSREACSRRLALVGTVILNRRRDTAIPELTLKLVDNVAAERDPLITKAVSWALRGLTKTHADAVKRYLERNRDRLPAIAAREVRNKLQTGLKNPKRRAAAST
jgi:3-methyladenine DNA glycosylase AlkD